MDEVKSRILWFGLAGTMLLVAIVFVLTPLPASSEKAPKDLRGLSRWLRAHPSDWQAASFLVEDALDSPSSSRFELWHAAHALATRLAPPRPNSDRAFVRSGLFHWYELEEPDRVAVLQAAEPILKDPSIFRDMAMPLWQLTRDFSLLRRAHPDTTEALEELEALAAMNGRFDAYRALRRELQRRQLAELESARALADPVQLIALVPPDFGADDEPMIRALLTELHRRPLDSKPLNPAVVDRILDYALRHDLQPLDGIDYVMRQSGAASDPMRARLALRLGDADRASSIQISSMTIAREDWIQYELERALFEARRRDKALAEVHLGKAAPGGPTPAVLDVAAQCEELLGDHAAAAQKRVALESLHAITAWQGLCGKDLCTSAAGQLYGPRLTIAITTVQSDEVPPYVEIYADDARVAEGEVHGRTLFDVPLLKRLHAVEVRLVNPFTRNRTRRIAHIE